MVGFGSSLRISRRRGWESAYIDYESLKLLLTHIEAVYEETRHLADRADPATVGAEADGGAGGGSFGLSIIGVPQGNGRGSGGGGEDRHVSALGHANFHFMETEDDTENHAHPHSHGAVGDMRSGRGGRYEGEGDGNKREGQDQKQHQQETPGDYRDELFLESDSDFAYMSVGEEAGSDMDDDDDSIGHHHLEAGDASGRMTLSRNDRDGMGRSAGGGGYEYNKSDDEDADAMMGPGNASRGFGQDETQRFGHGTAAADFGTEQSHQDAPGDVWRQQQMQDQHFQYGSGGADSHSFGGGGVAAEDSDDAMAIAVPEDVIGEDEGYLTDTSAHGGQVVNPTQESRYVYEPFSQIQSESTSLLRHSSRKNVAVAEESTSFFSFFSFQKKEEEAGLDRNKIAQQQQKAQEQGSAGAFANLGRSVVVVGGSRVNHPVEEQRQMINHQKLQQERLIPITGLKSSVNGDDLPRKRRVRMKRAKRRRRSRRKRRVPIHILIAHSKARAITERFLGLLRAEVEKVTLFAHARMGELADTVGSLRFPSYDDGTVGNKGDYPLSDGGIHPSASSSDEFGRTMSWSDSSSEDRDDERMKMRLKQEMDPAGRIRAPRRSVAAVAASVTAASKRRSSMRRTPDNQVTPHQGVAGYPTLTSDQDLALQQIQHAEQLRIARPTFQRAEHVLDDDFLLLSAVDEADAFAAVGVELMHLLRYICVNVIAVRKICKKHDRLLANRMLGGYYHRLRQQRRETEKAFKRLGLGAGGRSKSSRPRQSPQGLSGLDGGAASGQVPLLGRMFASTIGIGNELEGNLDKLVGVLDTKIQQLANSTTIEMISSVLAFALSEYEITQNRADALSKVNTATALRRAGSSANSLVSADADELEGLCYHFPIPKSAAFGLSPSPRKASALSSAQGYAMQQPRSPIETTFSSNSHDFDSNSSNMSLTRLKFVVASVYGLREAARPKQNHFRGYLSRAAMTFTGPNVVGDGLDGCSRETLEFLVAYDPDAALFVPCDTLYRSLQRGKSKGTVCGVMTASLAAANNGGETGSDYTVQNALTIMPVPSDYEYLESGLSSTLKGWKATVADGDVIVQRGTVRLNRLSVFLSCMNYYIISPSARAHTVILGEKMAHSATLIGVASISSIIGALIHSHLLSKDDAASKLPSAGPFFFRVPFILSAMSALAGNILYADASRHSSMLMAYCGRFLVGFGSSEVLNCNLISKCIPPAGLVSESAKLVKASMIGILIGPLMGMFLAIGEKEIISPFGEETLLSNRSVSAPGYFMAGLWFLQICGLLCFFQEPKKKAISASSNDKGGNMESIAASSNTATKAIDGKEVRDNTSGPGDRFAQEENGFISDSSSSSPQNAEIAEKRNLLYRTLSDATPDDLETAYGTNPASADRAGTSRANSKNFVASDDEYGSPDVAGDKRQRRRRPLLSSVNRARKLVFHNVALPATIAILAFATFTLETMFSSCAIVTYRYFHWNSALAGLWLAILGSLALPVNYVIESISRYREERVVMKIGLLFVGLGLVIIVNYEALLVLLLHLRDLFRKAEGEEDRPTTYYDWSLGIVQYVVGSLVIMVSIAAIEGCTLSLMSKVAPPKLESKAINLGLIVSLIRPSTRFMADVFILLIGLSHRIINTDIINSLSLVLICACCAVYYLVKRHYFFLSGH